VALAGGTAIVTGAASGMGRSTALLAASQGARVVCIDVADPAATVAEIVASGGAGCAIAGDVRDDAMWREAVELALGRFGSVDVLANVAGVVSNAGDDTVLDQTEEGWQRIIDVNLKGTWLGMQAVLPAMLERGAGRIVNVASIVAMRGALKLAAYSASKGAITALTRQAAVEYGRMGIRVNAVAPGDIDTPMSADAPAKVKAALIRRTPAGRHGTAEEVAAAIVFLAGPDADFINGHVLLVDGGWSASA
jgi:NAD(P)-dependent dehydrogenase (short-subunit alcohol dehydrogenase family)